MDARLTDTFSGSTSAPAEQAYAAPTDFDLRKHVALFRRRSRLFAAIVIGVVAASIIVSLLMRPLYTATAVVMLEPRQEKVVDIEQVMSGAPLDAAMVDTQVEVLKSRALAERVVAALHLEQDPEFAPRLKPGPHASAAELALLQAHRQSSTVDRVMKRTRIARSGLTYVIAVVFKSFSPEKAALIANGFADGYLTAQLDSKFDATRRASDWLNSRLAGLREQVEQAEGAVQAYRTAHGLMTSSEAGATITQQEISTLNTTYAAPKAEEAEANAKLETARRQIARGSTGDDLGDVLSSPVISQLRQQRASLSGQVADLSGRYGARHPEMLKAQRQLTDIDAQIQSEIRRLISNLEAQAQVARQRVASIGASLGSSKSSLATSNAASVKLNELQRNADSVRTLYQSFLDRFKQTTAQQGIEQSDARVVSRAETPVRPTFPSLPITGAVGLAVGLIAAVLTLTGLEAMAGGFYTSEDVERLLGAPHLASIPELSSTLDMPPGRQAGISPTRYVLAQPMSSLAESYRSLRTSILIAHAGAPVKTIAITSALPGEGKTTTCIGLGRIIAMGGASVVVVDCDVRRRTVNRLFAEEPEVGLLEVLSGAVPLDAALVRDEVTETHFLPLAHASGAPCDVFASAAMEALLSALGKRFQYVLLDTPPVLPVADTRILAAKVDVVVLIAKWRTTPFKAVESALKQLEAVGARVAGVALSRVDMREQARSGYGDAGYYYRLYKEYYNPPHEGPRHEC